MVRGILVVFRRGKSLLILSLLLNSSLALSMQCEWFLKGGPPAQEGRLISISVKDLSLNPGGLLGGVHYTEALARSYGIPQVGVKYESEQLRVLVEDHITGQVLENGEHVYLSGQLIEEFGEPLLLLTRKRTKALRHETESGGPQVLYFPLRD